MSMLTAPSSANATRVALIKVSERRIQIPRRIGVREDVLKHPTSSTAVRRNVRKYQEQPNRYGTNSSDVFIFAQGSTTNDAASRTLKRLASRKINRSLMGPRNWPRQRMEGSHRRTP